ncbi:hypothetical protein Peur_003903 [Populus x canadensis]|uniref:REF/SRPP-like protein At1g67360 n=1 Tax=Populus nigra TaxID=3691 RepID=UPI002B2742BD|nr:REF/SRPP-like protein At1g67360 [Populus nigra]
MEVENSKRKDLDLKHLGFVRIAAIQVVVCVSNLYDYAKRNSGPLRSAVGTVEGTVNAVVGPVYEKFKGVPDHLLVFLDHKVDEATIKFDKRAPPVAKQVVSQARYLIEKASEKAKVLANEFQAGGPRAAVHYVSTESKHLFLTESVKVWVKLDQYPSVHKVAEVAVPTAAHWSEKYNHFVKEMSQKGYVVFGYLPVVPVDEISNAFKQGEPEKKEDATAHKDSDSSDSD